jgi:hypothetical protein
MVRVMSNVDIGKLTPGTFGVSHGGGIPGALIRSATGSWAGHAFLYLGDGLIVQGQPPKAATAPADSHGDAIWAWRMWDQLEASGWNAQQLTDAQTAVVARGRGEIGCPYDYPAYAAFAAEVLHLRTETELAPDFTRDMWRVCSALVADALRAGAVPLAFVPEDGPGIIGKPGQAPVPPNLIAPGMLLGLAQRLEWT